MLPHHRSLDDPEAMAEERRLFYVGMTRAKNRVLLVRAFRRRVGGVFTVSEPSRFLEDICRPIWSTATCSEWGRRPRHFMPGRPAGSLPAPRPIGPRFAHGHAGAPSELRRGVVMETMLHSDDEEVTVEFERGRRQAAVRLARAAGDPGVSRPAAASDQSGRLAPAQVPEAS